MQWLWHRAIGFVMILVLWATGSPAEAQSSDQVAFLIRDSLKSTTRTLQGARKILRKRHPELAYHTFTITDDSIHNAQVLDSLRELDPRLILSVGTSATKFAGDHFDSTPIVFSAVKYPVLSGFVESMDRPGGNVTGASLNIPFDIQFKYFSEVCPNLSRVGVMYTENTAAIVYQAQLAAAAAGLTLVPHKILDIKDLPRALDSLAETCDGLWSVADPNLFDPRSTRYILLNTIRKGLPMMGFSRHVVESGALFALDFDYKAIGMQAGRAAERILDGEPAADIAVTMADVIWFHYNEKTAHHINVAVPEELVAIAKEVYR